MLMLKKFFPILFLMCLVFASCSSGQRIHHPGGKKKRNKDCDCPKWTSNFEAKQFLSYYDGE